MTSLAYANPQNADYYTVVEERSKGKETGSITAVDGQMDKGIKTVSYYDYRGRNIQTVSTNHLGGNDMLDDKSYGRIDDLTYKYNGNQVIKITDKVSGPYYKDAMHFVDGADAEIEYEYDKNGCMTKDLNKKISKIEYNLLNLPTKLNSADGSTISYSYDADGNKLRADYNLSLMNVINGTSSNAQAGNGVTTHRDYCGNFIYEDGALKMLLFDGGYVTFNSSNSPKYHFYLKDHLGNYRVVADANGNIEQVNHYYPFGGLMAESTGDVQPYKYNGKELDRMHGLDSYDYGARRMSDGRFSTQDPHAINYVGVSPYAYCGNNPMNAIDKNGEDSYYLTDGTYICDNLKETDHIYVVSNYNYLKQLPNGNRVVEFYGKQSLEEAKLSANAFSNIFTNVLKRNGFDVDKLENKSIAVNVLDNNTKGDGPHYRCIDFYNTTSYPWENAPIAAISNNKITVNVVLSNQEHRNYLSTISNVINVLGVHEYTGHGILKLGSDQHWQILKMQRAHPSWNNTTKKLKDLYLKLEKEIPKEYVKH